MMGVKTQRKIQFCFPERHSLHTRNEVMKPAHIFRDQVNTVAQWFDQWNDIEQTIACYSLLKRIGHTQARFLSLVLEHTFRDTAYEVNILEREANGKEFLRSLCHERKEIAVQQLLLHLPLLHPGNDEARHEYLKLLPKILSHSLEYSIHKEECRQLLSLALVHPAFVPEERNSLTWWLGLIEEKGDSINETCRPPPGFVNPALHTPLTSSKSCQVWGTNHHAPIKSSYSHKPSGQTNGWKGQTQLTHTDSGICTSFDNGSNNIYNAAGGNQEALEDKYTRAYRSNSFPVDPSNAHTTVSPQSSVDSDDETLRKESTNENAHPGMKDIPLWLKSLRLHKYAHIFTDVTYEEMMSFSDEYLEKHGVTKGARTKILLCIQKLKDREETLEQLEKEVLQLGCLPHVLAELKSILVTPIKPHKNENTNEESFNEGIKTDKCNNFEDLPLQIIRVMGKACTQILVTQPDEQCCITYLGLLERVLSHEAFSQEDKRRFHSWKLQCQKLARDFAMNRKLAGIEKGPRNWYDPIGGVHRKNSTHRINQQKAGVSYPFSGGSLVGSSKSKLTGSISYHPNTRASLSKEPLTRTKSAPTTRPHGQQDMEAINKSLESIGLSMTNHALEDASEKVDELY
ncbi:protein Smaug homolog 1 isoform X1 [Hydra vulgaris]|uniref:protein Smaug homolog 1 isoform X1 n=1 Tax=Hydra vulgaris TaxID=6087 RepID=UPI001F5E998D|nr:protein Smaug homolog 1 isoform X1 [Hydra vulgaris]